MKCSAKRALTVPLLLLVIFGLAVQASFCSSAEDASTRIASADAALQTAFMAVSDAEQAGANVSNLISTLNWAGGNLTSAQDAYASGDYDGAISGADQCSFLASQVAGEASALKSSAFAQARSAEWPVLMFSGVGGLVFVLVLVLAWVGFKRSYTRRVLGARPEVGSNAEA
jgi:hypothetical protein